MSDVVILVLRIGFCVARQQEVQGKIFEEDTYKTKRSFVCCCDIVSYGRLCPGRTA